MIFSQLGYFGLLILSVTFFFLVPKTWRLAVLTASGISFYVYFAGINLVIIAAELMLIWFLTRRYSHFRLNLAVIFAIMVLAYFKYWTRISPLAISFFTFEFIHFIVERRKKTIRSFSLSQLSAFIFFFPTLVAGPIKRFPDFNRQIKRAKLLPDHVFIGAVRIILGLFKKLVLADTFAVISGNTLLSASAIRDTTPLLAWVSLISYSFRIYLDFSGYSDIAIGSARLFGIIIPENFILPYLRTNIASFWKHWHRTLYSWIVDYLFIPLGGSRRGPLIAARNTLIAMSLSGLWHGAAGHFLVCGFYHGVLLAGYRIYKSTFPSSYIPAPISVIITFVFVSLGWLLFIAPVKIAALAAAKLVGINL